MTEELIDSNAWVCRDCLFLLANGDGPNYEYDYPGKTEAEYAEMYADYNERVARETDGYRITLGHGREQHTCATNATVTPIYRTHQDNGVDVTYLREEEAKEYRAINDLASEAIESAEFDFPAAIGFRVIMHDLETQGDRGGECDCEELSFSTQDCANCGTYHAGTWHAATVWKTTDTSGTNRGVLPTTGNRGPSGVPRRAFTDNPEEK